MLCFLWWEWSEFLGGTSDHWHASTILSVMGHASRVPLGWSHYTVNNVPQHDWLTVIRYYVSFLSSHDNIGKCWGDDRMVLYASVVFACPVTFPKGPFPSHNHSQHLLLLLLFEASFGKYWCHWMLKSPPCMWHTLWIQFPPPLGTVEIQMTHLHIIYHRGCVLKLKPSTRSFSWDFIYSISVPGHTGNTLRVVSSPFRVCLGQPYGLIQGLYVWKLIISEKAQEVMFTLKAESSF